MFRLISFSIFILLGLTVDGNTVDISENDSGKIISVAKGEIATIKLAENPTTGYGWIFEIDPEEQKVISVISSKFIEPTTALLGAGGTKEYKFEVKNAGQIKINGYYVRPWEELNKNEATQVHYTIKAQD